jgi:hypothetical protein
MQRVGEVVQADMVLSRHDGWRCPSGRLDFKLADDHMNTKAWKAADASGANVSTQGVHLSSILLGSRPREGAGDSSASVCMTC